MQNKFFNNSEITLIKSNIWVPRDEMLNKYKFNTDNSLKQSLLQEVYEPQN